MTWYLILLGAAVVALVAYVWIRQARHPVEPGRGPGLEARIEDHHRGWGNGASGKR
jgi:hypothetical protein